MNFKGNFWQQQIHRMKVGPAQPLHTSGGTGTPAQLRDKTHLTPEANLGNQGKKFEPPNWKRFIGSSIIAAFGKVFLLGVLFDMFLLFHCLKPTFLFNRNDTISFCKCCLAPGSEPSSRANPPRRRSQRRSGASTTHPPGCTRRPRQLPESPNFFKSLCQAPGSAPSWERRGQVLPLAREGARCPAAPVWVADFSPLPRSFTCTGNLEEQIIQSAAGLPKTLMKALFI